MRSETSRRRMKAHHPTNGAAHPGVVHRGGCGAAVAISESDERASVAGAGDNLARGDADDFDERDFPHLDGNPEPLVQPPRSAEMTRHSVWDPRFYMVRALHALTLRQRGCFRVSRSAASGCGDR